MKTCENCKKGLHFWNSYHRKYPSLKVTNGKTTNVNFCSSKCVFDYIKKLSELKNEN